MDIQKLKKKSDRRKRQLRNINEKIKRYIAVTDAAISDAARFKTEAALWRERYFELLEKKESNGENNS